LLFIIDCLFGPGTINWKYSYQELPKPTPELKPKPKPKPKPEPIEDYQEIGNLMLIPSLNNLGNCTKYDYNTGSVVTLYSNLEILPRAHSHTTDSEAATIDSGSEFLSLSLKTTLDHHLYVISFVICGVIVVIAFIQRSMKKNLRKDSMPTSEVSGPNIINNEIEFDLEVEISVDSTSSHELII
jgi:hypothetical protein